MISMFADFNKRFLLFFFFVLSVGVSIVHSQTNSLPENWYCDARWKGEIYTAMVKSISPYSKPKVNVQNKPDKFSAFAAEHKAENIIKFTIEKSYKSVFEAGSELEVFNIKTKELPAIKFKIGEKYLLYLKTFSFYEGSKSYSVVKFVSPDGRTKPYSEDSATVGFLEMASKIDFDKEVLGFDGEVIRGGVIGGKAVSLPKPPYPPEAKKDKARGAINIYVLIDTNGKVIKAKALCPVHQSLGEAAESAALAAQFSPTIISGKPVRVQGIIVYNFVP